MNCIIKQFRRFAYVIVFPITLASCGFVNEQISDMSSVTDTVFVTADFKIKDPSTESTSFTNQLSINVEIDDTDEVIGWCLSESQSTQPNDTCVGGSGPDKGWYTSRPSTFTLSNQDGQKKVYLWLRTEKGVSATAQKDSILLDRVAPLVSLDSQPSDPTNLVVQSFTYSATDTNGSGVEAFYCKINSGSYAPCTSPANFNSLSEGSHTFYVKAIDKAQNESTVTTYSFTKDTSSPTIAFDSTPPSVDDSDSASFQFTADDGTGTGIKRIECNLDNTTWSTCTSAHNLSSLTDGAHSFQIRAIDNADNISTIITHNWTVDTTAPTLTYNVSPSSPTNATTITVSGNCSDAGSGIATNGIKICIKKGGTCAAYPSADYSVSVACSSGSYTYDQAVTTGTYDIEVVAIDAVGNIKGPVGQGAMNYEVDQDAPADFSITGITGGSDTTADAWLKANSDASLNWNDTSGEDSYDVTIYQADGSTVQCATQSVAADSTSYQFTGCTLTDGVNYKASVIAKDSAGNTKAATNNLFTFMKDYTAPTLGSYIDPSSNVTTSNNSYEFSWNAATDAHSGLHATQSYQVELFSNGTCTGTADSTINQTSTSYDYTGLSAGNSYSIRVSARDQAGNTSSACSPSVTKLISLSVAAVYPTNGANWNYYVKYDDTGSDVYHQDDVACAGSESGYYYDVCIHGGEKKKVVATGKNSCTNLSLTDDIGAFDWECQVDAGTATFYSKGLKTDKGLKDLVNASSWKDNKVSLYQGSDLIGESTASAWWTNPVAPLPDNSSSIRLRLDGTDDDGTGPDQAYTAGTIFTLDGSTHTASNGYNLNLDRLAIVTLDGVTLSYGGSTSDNINFGTGDAAGTQNHIALIGVGDQKFIWVEGNYDGYNATQRAKACILIGSGKFNLVRNTTLASCNIGAYMRGNSTSKHHFENVIFENNLSYGVYYSTGGSWISYKNIISQNNSNTGLHITSSSRISIEDAIVSGNSGSGLLLGETKRAIVKNVKAFKNTSQGLIFDEVWDLKLTDIISTNNGTYGIYFTNPNRYITAQNIRLANNGSIGLHISGLSYSTLTNIITTNNGSRGIHLSSALLGVTFHHVLVANNDSYGIYATDITGPTMNQFVVVNNDLDGMYLLDSSTSRFSQFTIANNNGYAIYMKHATGHVFSNNLVIGSNNATCGFYSFNGAEGLGWSCVNNGSSTANLTTTADLTSSFVGKVLTDDTTNSSDNLGSIEQSLITDWYNFENWFRVWGIDGSNFPNVDHADNCSSGSTCRIWDWRLNSSDSVIRNTSGDGATANDPFVSGATCPAAVNGNVTVTDTFDVEIFGDGVGDDDYLCEASEDCTGNNTFLANAVEILNDGVGDDDGLCESNEACIYSPNFGPYQGEGDYTTNGTCVFQDGTVSGVTMYAYPTN